MRQKDTCTHSELIARVVEIDAGLVALKELLAERDVRYKQRAAAQDAAVKNALETSEKAITKAEGATERRFEGVNEFRQTLADQASTLMPRAEYTVQHRALEDKVTAVESRVSSIQQEISTILARGVGMKEAWGYLIGAAGFIAAAGIAYFHH